MIVAHPFIHPQRVYRDVDFERLYQRKVTPPFNPKVKSAADMKFVPSTYHKMPVSPLPHSPQVIWKHRMNF